MQTKNPPWGGGYGYCLEPHNGGLIMVVHDCNTMQMFTHLQCKAQRKTEECQKRKTSQEEKMKLQLVEKQLEQC